MKLKAERYVDDVLSGRQVACEWVAKACQRHRRDLKEGHERGLWFDKEAAKVAIAFFGLLKHSKGEWAGKPVTLEPWQQFHIWSLFGWKRADGTRRFRTSYLEVARKNGKSLMASGVGLLLLVADGEMGCEVYTAATKFDQAKIVHSEAIRMVNKSPLLQKSLKVYVNNISDLSTESKFVPLGADSKTLDGLNVHGALVDELHAHPDGALWDVLETATGARRQPLMYSITTAGDSRSSFCFQMHEYTQKILDGVLHDDSFWGCIYTLDKSADGVYDWEDSSQWVKANPNLGVSKKLDNMEDKAHKAAGMTSRLQQFKQKELNLWVQGVNKWVNLPKWMECGERWPFDNKGLSWERHGMELMVAYESFLSGRKCAGGLDLSSTIDVSAWVLVFEPAEIGEPHWVLPRFFIPEENMIARVRDDRVPYDLWWEQGLVTATPGDAIDYAFIIDQIAKDAERFDIADVGFDRWGATEVSQQLRELGGEDFMVQFGQGFASMSSPMKALEVLIMRGLIGHVGHPVLTWMADNVVARSDPAGNVKPDKGMSREKIDGVVALIMGLDRVQRHEAKKESRYEGAGIRTL